MKGCSTNGSALCVGFVRSAASGPLDTRQQPSPSSLGPAISTGPAERRHPDKFLGTHNICYLMLTTRCALNLIYHLTSRLH
mgnify:CR=1 FL=1